MGQTFSSSSSSSSRPPLPFSSTGIDLNSLLPPIDGIPVLPRDLIEIIKSYLIQSYIVAIYRGLSSTHECSLWSGAFPPPRTLTSPSPPSSHLNENESSSLSASSFPPTIREWQTYMISVPCSYAVYVPSRQTILALSQADELPIVKEYKAGVRHMISNSLASTITPSSSSASSSSSSLSSSSSRVNEWTKSANEMTRIQRRGCLTLLLDPNPMPRIANGGPLWIFIGADRDGYGTKSVQVYDINHGEWYHDYMLTQLNTHNGCGTLVNDRVFIFTQTGLEILHLATRTSTMIATPTSFVRPLQGNCQSFTYHDTVNNKDWVLLLGGGDGYTKSGYLKPLACFILDTVTMKFYYAPFSLPRGTAGEERKCFMYEKRYLICVVTRTLSDRYYKRSFILDLEKMFHTWLALPRAVNDDGESPSSPPTWNSGLGFYEYPPMTARILVTTKNHDFMCNSESMWQHLPLAHPWSNHMELLNLFADTFIL